MAATCANSQLCAVSGRRQQLTAVALPGRLTAPWTRRGVKPGSGAASESASFSARRVRRSDAGASRQLVESALDRRLVLLVSVPLMVESEAVLLRQEHLDASQLSAEEVGVILDALAAVGEAVRLSFLWRPRLTDPADDMVLETAVNGGAQLLVTFNRRHFARAARHFQVTIASPAEALKQLEMEHEKE